MSGAAQVRAEKPIELIHAIKDVTEQPGPRFSATIIDYGMQRMTEAFCEQIGIRDPQALSEFLRTDAGKTWRRGCMQLLAQVTAKAAMAE